MASTEKDTIYIDVDDEITAIIEKVKKSKSKIVALVLPKRAAVLQSIVNMKLLKKTADEAGKRAVLITSEAGLLPLAGAVGLYVAKNLQSKPEIPPAPEIPPIDDEEIHAELDDDAELDKKESVGKLAGAAGVGAAIGSSLKRDKSSSSKSATKPAKPKKDKAKKIPNFEKFRSKLFLAIAGGILLLFGFYWALFRAPALKAVIATDSTTTNPIIAFTVDPSASGVDTSKKVVAGKTADKKETGTEDADATGEKDVGEKATGTVNMSISCGDVGGSPPTIPAGTGVSSGNLTYLTQSTVSLTTPNFQNGCNFVGSTKVTAQNNGDQYNASPRSYSVSGFSNVSAQGSEMSGGTSKVIKVVSQQDVDNAKGKIADNSSAVKDELKKQLESEGYFAITDSFGSTDEKVSSSPKVGEEGNEVSVTAEVTYSMTGVKQEDLHALVENAVKSELESTNQQIQDDGLGDAVFRVVKRSGNGVVQLSMQPTVTLGPNIDIEGLKTQIAGKKKGDTENIIKSVKGVNDVELDYSPFWVSRTPRSTNKITIEFKKTE